METFFQGHIDGLLVAASWVERLRLELGLKGVHQVWGGGSGLVLMVGRLPRCLLPGDG